LTSRGGPHHQHTPRRISLVALAVSSRHNGLGQARHRRPWTKDRRARACRSSRSPVNESPRVCGRARWRAPDSGRETMKARKKNEQRSRSIKGRDDSRHERRKKELVKRGRKKGLFVFSFWGGGGWGGGGGGGRLATVPVRRPMPRKITRPPNLSIDGGAGDRGVIRFARNRPRNCQAQSVREK